MNDGTAQTPNPRKTTPMSTNTARISKPATDRPGYELKPPGKFGSAIVKPFTVPVQWVQVTVHVEAKTLAELATYRTETQADYVWHIENSVNSVLIARRGNPGASPRQLLAGSPRLGWDFRVGLDRVPGRKLAPFTLTMKRARWDDLERAAQALYVAPADIVRAALYQRMKSLREYHGKAASA